MSTADHVLRAALQLPPTLGGRCRVVAVDGPAGSGKTTLAAAIVTTAADRAAGLLEVVHLDDLYDGWRGVRHVNALVATVLRSLHAAGEAAYLRYDWDRAAYAEVRRIDLPDLLVLEGVGSSVPAVDPLVTLRVWVDAPVALRLDRGLRRDGEHLRPEWEQFLRDEQEVHARDRTRERADLLVDGTTGRVSPAVARSVAPAPHGRR